jgi:hypothetical protein
VTTPVNPRTDPTERSNPPEIIRIIIPTAIVASTDRESSIACRLPTSRNTGEAKAIAMPMTIRTTIRAILGRPILYARRAGCPNDDQP